MIRAVIFDCYGVLMDAEGRRGPNLQLFAYSKDKLKPGYAIGMLSNAGVNRLADMFSSDQLDLFDAVSLSCDSGFLKPDEGAYLAIAGKLGLDTAECLFIDDIEGYCTAARQAGMQAVIYRSHDQSTAAITAALGNG